MTRIRTYASVALGLLAAGTLFLGCNDKDEDRAKNGTAGTTGAAVTTQAGITPTGQVSYVFSSSVAGNGSGAIAITPAPGAGDLIPAGTVVTVTPTAAPGSRFDGWGGDFAGNIDNPLRLTMARDTVLVANFIIPPPGVPTAAFTHTPDPAMWIAPLDVTFTDGSSDQPTSWLWDFGDGVTSTLQNPTHTYTRAGTYTVTLEVSNAVGTSLPLVKRDLIEVAPATAGSRYWYQGDVYGNPFKVHTGAEAGFAQQVLTLVNQERTSRGLNALQWDAEAERAAKAHADDMKARNYFSHVSPEGWSPGDRLVWTGATGYSNYAENIAWGQRDPAAVMVAWMNSPGHRANILDPSFTHLGVGVANPQPYWVQVFLTR